MIKLPEPQQLDKYGNNKRFTIPLPNVERVDQFFKFSFEMFDREHPLFNLGSKEHSPVAISGEWFISFFDCLKDVSLVRISDLCRDSHDLHPVNWNSKNINTKKPSGHEQLDYWQFRLNKSNGRVIGVKIDNIFYVVWLDPYHNLVDSEGYGKAIYYYHPLTDYEILQNEKSQLEQEVAGLKENIKIYEELESENK